MARWRQVDRFVADVLWPLRRSRQKTIAALTVGLAREQQAGLAGVARGMVDDTTVKHRVKRAGRFTRNRAIDPWQVTQCLAEVLLPAGRQNVVLLDWTDRGSYALLQASVYYQRRALPLAWQHVEKGAYGEDAKSQNAIEERFVRRLASCIGPQRPWVLVADRGFRRVAFLEHLDALGIAYVIRLKDDVWVDHERFEGVLCNLPVWPGMLEDYHHVRLHRTKPLPVRLVVSHTEPAAEAWYLATNLDTLSARRIVRLYAQRMGIEQGFRDCKSGLGLKRLKLSEAERLDRFMVIVVMTCLLIALTAAANQQRGERLQVSTSKRQAPPVSYFTLGRRILKLYPQLLCTHIEALYEH